MTLYPPRCWKCKKYHVDGAKRTKSCPGKVTQQFGRKCCPHPRSSIGRSTHPWRTKIKENIDTTREIRALSSSVQFPDVLPMLSTPESTLTTPLSPRTPSRERPRTLQIWDHFEDWDWRVSELSEPAMLATETHEQALEERSVVRCPTAPKRRLQHSGSEATKKAAVHEVLAKSLHGLVALRACRCKALSVREAMTGRSSKENSHCGLLGWLCVNRQVRALIQVTLSGR